MSPPHNREEHRRVEIRRLPRPGDKGQREGAACGRGTTMVGLIRQQQEPSEGIRYA